MMPARCFATCQDRESQSSSSHTCRDLYPVLSFVLNTSFASMFCTRHLWTPLCSVRKEAMKMHTHMDVAILCVASLHTSVTYSLLWFFFFFWKNVRPNSHRTRDTTRDATQANGTCCRQWEYSHCSKQHQRKNVPICMRVASRVLCKLGLTLLPLEISPEVPGSWQMYKCVVWVATRIFLLSSSEEWEAKTIEVT